MPVAGQLGGQPLELGRVAGAENQGGPPACQLGGDRAAQAAGGAGEQGLLAGQLDEAEASTGRIADRVAA
jgi:hypothetical protein